MLTELIQVKKCPFCDELFKVVINGEDDLKDSMMWTDGKIIGPKFCMEERVVSCPTCKTAFWGRDAETAYEIDEDQFFLDDPEGIHRYWKVEPARKPEVKDYLKLLSTGISEKDDEMYIRISLMHLWNDRRRNGFISEIDHDELANLEALTILIEPKETGRLILLAEVYRELGRFEVAARLMALAEPVNDDWVMYIRYLASIEDSHVRPYEDVPKDFALQITLGIPMSGCN